MAKEESFDVVSKVDLQEVRNAIQQAQKEIQTRFDFRGTHAGIEYDEEKATVQVMGDHTVQLKSVIDVVETKLAKRNVNVRSLVWKTAEQLPSGLMKRQAVFQQGIADEKAKNVIKAIRGLGLKVQPRIQGDVVRVTGKSRNELQAVIQALREQDFGIPVQFENYR